MAASLGAKETVAYGQTGRITGQMRKIQDKGDGDDFNFIGTANTSSGYLDVKITGNDNPYYIEPTPDEGENLIGQMYDADFQDFNIAFGKSIFGLLGVAPIPTFDTSELESKGILGIS